jgi:hypothetical protein
MGLWHRRRLSDLKVQPASLCQGCGASPAGAVMSCHPPQQPPARNRTSVACRTFRLAGRRIARPLGGGFAGRVLALHLLQHPELPKQKAHDGAGGQKRLLGTIQEQVVQIGSPLLSTAALCPFRPRRSASPCRPGCPQGTRRSTSRHRSRGVAHVSGAPRHGATGPPAARVPGAPTGPVGRHPAADARRDFGTRAMRSSTPGPGRHRRTPRTRVTRAGARATARSADVMRDTAGAVSRAPNPGILRCGRRRASGGHPSGRGGTGFALATPLPRCRACVRRSAPRGDRATCGSGTGGPRPARSVDIPLPTRGATSAPARCDLQTPGPGRHRRTPRTRVTRAGARATARSAEVMRDTAGAVSRAPMSVGIPMPTRVPAGHPEWRSPVTPGVGRRPRGRDGKGLPPYGPVGLTPVSNKCSVCF